MKKIILTFFIWLFWYISFWYCADVSSLLDYLASDTVSYNDTNIHIIYNTPNDWVYCIEVTSQQWQWEFARWDWVTTPFLNGTFLTFYSDFTLPYTFCMWTNQPYLALRSYNWWGSLTYNLYNLDVFMWTEIPVYSSLECQSEYNLIPIEDVDSEYCVLNDLCPSSECTSWFSTLYINNIEHQSAPLIDITIPEEFEWNYTWTNELFELDVVWYNTDPDYIAWIITTQKTTPNNQDFNNIITWLIPLLIPWLVVILFIYFVFRFVKKIF